MRYNYDHDTAHHPTAALSLPVNLPMLSTWRAPECRCLRWCKMWGKECTKEEEEEEKAEEEEAEEQADIKSNNPHLTGGE